MSVIISIETPGKTRHHHHHTIAEALRRLSQKTQLDDEAKNLATLIVFCLQDITDTVGKRLIVNRSVAHVLTHQPAICQELKVSGSVPSRCG